MTFLYITSVYLLISVLIAARAVGYVENIRPTMLDRYSGEVMAGIAGVLWPLTIMLYFAFRVGSAGVWVRGNVRQVGRDLSKWWDGVHKELIRK